MEIGFFYDGPITQDSQGYYYGVALNNRLFSRYLQFADRIHLCMRLDHSDQVSRMTKLSMEQMDFTECVNLLTATGVFKTKKAEEIVKSVLNKCDAAIIRIPSRIGHVAINCCKKMNKPYLVELVGCPWDSFWNHSIKGKIVAYPFATQTKKDVYNSPAVLYVTNKFLQQRYPTKGTNIGCSDVELRDLDEQVLVKRIQRIQNQNGRMIIGTTAAVDVKFKGQQYIIAALGYLKKKGDTNYEYHLVGTGNQDFLKKIAKKFDVEEQVKFLGGLPHDKVFDWLDTIDMYVQPSKQEGLPRALVEAMSRGIPAFGSRTGGIPELLSPELIFDNTTMKNLKEIAMMIQKFNKEMMIEQAKKNFLVAKEFDRNLLHKKRSLFYSEFFSNVSKLY